MLALSKSFFPFLAFFTNKKKELRNTSDNTKPTFLRNPFVDSKNLLTIFISDVVDYLITNSRLRGNRVILQFCALCENLSSSCFFPENCSTQEGQLIHPKRLVLGSTSCRVSNLRSSTSVYPRRPHRFLRINPVRVAIVPWGQICSIFIKIERPVIRPQDSIHCRRRYLRRGFVMHTLKHDPSFPKFSPITQSEAHSSYL